MENTLIIFTSDYGEYLGAHGKIPKGMPAEDCISRVSCIISYPPLIGRGLRIDTICEAVDLVPAILDFCGVQNPPWLQGKSMKALLNGKTPTHRDSALTESFDHRGKRSSSIWRREFRNFIDSPGNEKFLDIRKDPREIRNVIDNLEYGAHLSSLRRLMIGRLFQADYHEHTRQG